MINQLIGGYEWRIPHNGELLQAYLKRAESEHQYAFWRNDHKPPFELTAEHKAMIRCLMSLDDAGLRVSSMSHNCKFAVYFPFGVSRQELMRFLERKHIHPQKVLIPTGGNLFRVQWE